MSLRKPITGHDSRTPKGGIDLFDMNDLYIGTIQMREHGLAIIQCVNAQEALLAELKQSQRKYHEAMDIMAAWENIDHALATAQLVEHKKVVADFIDSFELDFVWNGQIVDNPQDRWRPLLDMYNRMKALAKDS